jgi:hypothetical protein
MVFGSYFGDWNTEDNFMRSLLADGKMLTTCWAGRPNWFFHHMGLNNPIGTSSKMSVENSSNSWYLNTTPYDIYGYYSNGVHMQLLGDMSLRQNYKKAIGTFNTAYNTNTSSVDLTWAPPVGELVTEYKIYKSSDSLDNYTLLTTLLSTDSTFSDSLIASTGNYYYISYVTLDTTNSGSYYNRSTGTYGSSDTTGFAAMSALPMELISFDVVNENGTAKLQWSTSSEINSSHFELEKSIDGLTWSVFDEVQAAGHSSAIINYGGFDYNLSTMKTYYRLRLVDFDGTWEYSDVRVIDQKINTLSIYPNPSNLNKINLKGWLEPIDIDQLRITDTRGVDVPFTLSTADPGQIGLEQKPGVYYLNYNNEHIKFILL